MKRLTSVDAPASAARRRFVLGLTGGAVAALAGPAFNPAFAAWPTSTPVLHGTDFELTIDERAVNFTGKRRMATVINGSLPAPLLRMREGDDITIRVTNRLDVMSSIHWHGLILPSNMDGVPGLSFAGIEPGETYVYRFKAVQSGTYWYHSHSGHQEQTGMYGAIVIEPKEVDPVVYDREHVILLSDWSDETPHAIYAKLKKQSHYYNRDERTVGDLLSDINRQGLTDTVRERHMWNDMRMSDRDISDVTGMTYTFLTNGVTPASGWEGLFRPGERVRLRFINGSAMTFFDVRIPGLKMTVVASDGQDIQPVAGIDEFRIGVAETYDVIVEPEAGTYSIFAQAIDRSGYARGTLTSLAGHRTAVPAMDPKPILTHGDMGMDHTAMGHDMAGMDHSAMGHDMGAMAGVAGENPDIEVKPGPHIDMMAEAAMVRLDDPGVGLRNNGRRVLTYADIRNRYPTRDTRTPGREIVLHLTGNMSRYMWSINGVKFADAKPILLRYGERVRVTLINDTMMNHPIHLHGMWSELETGDPDYLPRKHTVVVQPGARLSYLVTADALGQWAFHCHLLYHMDGMFRRVVVA